MTTKYFYIETSYQFLIALNLLHSDKAFNRAGLESVLVVFIDATRDSFLQKNKSFISKQYSIEVDLLKKISFYRDALFSVADSKRYRGLDDKASFYFFNNRSPVANKISSFFKRKNVFLVEEGLSLYRASKVLGLYGSIKKVFKEKFIAVLSFCAYSDTFGESRYVGNVMMHYPEAYRALQNNLSYTIIKLPDLKSLKTIKQDLVHIFECDDFSLDYDKKYVIFFGQPLSELNLMNKEDELKLIVELNDRLVSIGFTLMVKTHPLDEPNKYDAIGCRIITSKAPAEILFLNSINIYGVFTYYSTSAINVGAALEVPIFFLLNHMEDVPFTIHYPEGIGIHLVDQLDESLRVLNTGGEHEIRR